jgi:Flp pilus assembly CpaF family ATPase
VDARMDGFRVAAALSPTSVRGPSMCIRKHNPVHLKLDDYVKAGAITPEWAERLREMVRSHKNILVAGATSSGKTTAVNALLAEIPPEERILTIEDTPELKVISPNWVSLESNAQKGVSTRELVRLALRYRPDRVIVGEVRGGEAFDLLDAANTGHDGVIATLHASSALDALSRFETLILRGGVEWPHRAICAQIARTIDYVVFMARRNGVRGLQEVLEIEDFIDGRYVTKMLFDSLNPGDTP